MLKGLFKTESKDDWRHFVDMPEVIFFDHFYDYLEELEGAEITSFVPDGTIEMRLDFDFHGHKFFVDNQLGEYRFFVQDRNCPEEILFEIIDHFRALLEEE
jgi:hypothetical protein